MFENIKVRLRQSHGFQVLKFIIALLVFLLITVEFFPGLFGRSDGEGWKRAATGRLRLNEIMSALNAYANDFNVYPPNPNSELNSGQILRLYLTQKLEEKGKTYGPYLPSDTKVLISPLGGQYEYRALTTDPGTKLRFVLVDTGSDQKLGGYINPDKGFLKTSDEADDNLIGSATHE